MMIFSRSISLSIQLSDAPIILRTAHSFRLAFTRNTLSIAVTSVTIITIIHVMIVSILEIIPIPSVTEEIIFLLCTTLTRLFLDILPAMTSASAPSSTRIRNADTYLSVIPASEPSPNSIPFSRASAIICSITSNVT